MVSKLLRDSCNRVLLKKFPYGKHLGRKIMNSITAEGVESPKFNSETYRNSSILWFISRCDKWTETDWIRNWCLVKDEFGKFLFPTYYKRYHHTGFKLFGHWACKFGSETLSFVDRIVQKWRRKGDTDRHSDKELQEAVDLLEMVITDSLVDASVRNEWIKKLADICQRYHKIPKRLRLSGLEFLEDRKFGFGGSADVLPARLDGDEVAVKVPNAKVMTKSKKYDGEVTWTPLHSEALNWIGLDYPGLNKFYGVTLDHPKGIGLVSEYQRNGNSVEYLRSSGEEERNAFVQDKAFNIVSAINTLHQLNLIHGDIKGENILIDEDGYPVLTDFGLMSRLLTEDESGISSSITGGTDASNVSSGIYDCTVWFSSRERVFEFKRSEADDVWGFGMTLIQLLTGRLPFIHKYRHERAFVVALGKGEIYLQREDLPDAVPDALFRAIEQCLDPNPADRPSSLNVLSMMGKIAGTRALAGVMAGGSF